MTDTKKFDFTKTNDALSELSEAVVKLGSIITSKKSELTKKEKQFSKDLANKDKALLLLKESSSNVISNIDTVLNKLNKVLENDGSDNNNN